MLSPNEIADLEKKVFKYRLKQRLYVIILGIMSLLILCLSIYLYPDYFSTPTLNETQSSKASPTSNSLVNHEMNLSHTVSVLSPVEHNTTTYTPPPVSIEKKQETLALHLPIIDKKGPEKQSYSGIQEEEIESKILMRKIPLPQISHNDVSNQTKEEKFDTALLPPPLMDEPKSKSLIKIETSDVNSIVYLKERFDKTHNIVFALMLAEEYYKNNNYNESNKWALIANNMDAENEKSWIWFAKSKVKLGQKEDAILALQAYLKSNKSKAAQGLLNQITIGATIE